MATQQSVARRAVLQGALAAPAAVALGLPALALPADPLPGLVRDFKAALAGFTAAADEPGAGDFDTPECLHFEAEMNRLRALIICTPATTAEGIAAQVEFIKVEYEGGTLAAVGNIVNDVPVALLDTIVRGAMGL